MSFRRLLCFTVVTGLVWSLPVAVGAARAQTIEEARGHWFDADFEAARDEFRAVLANPALTAAQAIDAHRYLAAIHLALGEEPEARAQAEAAVALDPAVAPPEGAPRGAEDLFRMARRRLGDRRAELTVEPRGALAPGLSVTLVARLEPAPSELAPTLVLRCGSHEQMGPAPRLELVVVPTADLLCTAEARTAAGAVLLTVTRELDVVREDAAADSGAPVEHRRRRWPWIVGGSVAFAAIVGVVTGVVVHERNQEASFGGTTVVGW